MKLSQNLPQFYTHFCAQNFKLSIELHLYSPLAEPPMIEPCRACDEAKYEAIFQGLWSRQTHPKDFPHDEWRTEFSKIIGASHSLNYT